MLGEKRNIMVDLAQGEYVVHVDDDDRLHPEYIQTLLNAINETHADVITFLAEVTINGETPKICDYSIHHQRDYNTHNEYKRLPNHICCVKKSVSVKASFPSIPKGEDSAYSKLLLQHIVSEHQIKKVLYYYDYNDDTTETQQTIESKIIRKMKGRKAIVDVVILSNAKNNAMKAMTQNAINSCKIGANQLGVSITVIEQAKNVKYENAKTIYTENEFNYNKFANYGASLGDAEWIMIANNDLEFKNGWLHELLIADYPLVSPHEPRDPRQADITKNTKGTQNGKHFSGWCFMISRKLWKKIGGFDEDFYFWFADDSVIQQCVNAGIEPMVVKKSIVRHKGSVTLRTESPQSVSDKTWGLVEKFNKKYNQNKFEDNEYYKAWKAKQQSA